MWAGKRKFATGMQTKYTEQFLFAPVKNENLFKELKPATPTPLPIAL
jgi:hypothetical protein